MVGLGRHVKGMQGRRAQVMGGPAQRSTSSTPRVGAGTRSVGTSSTTSSAGRPPAQRARGRSFLAAVKTVQATVFGPRPKSDTGGRAARAVQRSASALPDEGAGISSHFPPSCVRPISMPMFTLFYVRLSTECIHPALSLHHNPHTSHTCNLLHLPPHNSLNTPHTH